MTSNPPSYLNAQRPFSPSIRQRNNRSPAQGSATQTVTSTPDRSESPDPLVLRLRGAHTPVSLSDSADDTTTQRRRPRIQWAEDVIDNEGLGRKSSKVCCIYHKPRAAGESSDESSSDSSSDDPDSDAGRDGARPAAGRNRRGRPHGHGHGNGHGNRDSADDGCADHDHTHSGDSTGRKSGKPKRRPSPNAYEKLPKYDVKPLTRQPGVGPWGGKK